MLTKEVALLGATMLALLASGAVDASLQSRERYSLHSPLQPRILNVYSEAGWLYIAGQNLPAGEGVRVRLGKQRLEVVQSSRTLLISRMPETFPGGRVDLKVERGVRRARIDGSKVRWGLQLPRHTVTSQ